MRRYNPMLCKLTEAPFIGDGFIWEQKLDGIRIISYPNGRLITRTGKDITHAFPEVTAALPPHLTLDGEIVSGDKFGNIQHRLRLNDVIEASRMYPAVFKVFDILSIDDTVDVSSAELVERKEILRSLLPIKGVVSRVDYWKNGHALFKRMEELGLEGVVGKNLGEPYIEGKRRWLKVKCWQYDTFMCVGYTRGTGWRLDTFGALVLQDLDGKPVGQVGTGFDVPTIKMLMDKFNVTVDPKVSDNTISIEPFPVRIKYLEYTNDGILRFPVYQGLEG